MCRSMAVEERGEIHEQPQTKSEGKMVKTAIVEEDSSMEEKTTFEEESTSSTSSPAGELEADPFSRNSSGSDAGTCSASTEKNIFQLAQQALIQRNTESQWKNMVGEFKKKLLYIPFLGNHDFSKNTFKRKLARFRSSDEPVEYGGFPIPKPSWRSFRYSELKAATDNFSSEKMIGKGGNAEVYEGCLPDGQCVAVKKLTKNDGKEEGDKIGDFLAELGIIAHINHPNAARLIGFSIDKGLHLILQLLPRGSLASVLHGSSETLDWKTRFNVALGIAEGLKYLHFDCPRRIIHRDITASNILLTEDYEAQISDFGLAKWLPEKWAHHIVYPIEGTFGYLAPEYFMHGMVDERTDTFAFGVLLLEILTGRHAVDSCQSLVIWAKPLLHKNNTKALVDPRLEDEYDPAEMKRCMTTVSACINHLPDKRPSMKQVVKILKGSDSTVELKDKSITGKSVVLDGCDLQDYTSSSYFDELDRHRQLALG